MTVDLKEWKTHLGERRRLKTTREVAGGSVGKHQRHLLEATRKWLSYHAKYIVDSRRKREERENGSI
jgi:hypothetical protein